MKRFWCSLLVLLGMLTFGGACWADDASLGLYAHDIPLMGKRAHEGGEEAIAAWSGQPVQALKVIGSPTPYVTAGANLQNKTDFAAAGLRWKVDLGRRLYVQAGGGMAINDAPTHPVAGRIYSGSHVTFEPEASLGWKLNGKVAVEASYIHLSHAYMFSNRNPGINELGLRLVVKFDRGALWRRMRGAG
jgi:hypothetical protein